jgi:hypothetical protein
LGTPPGDVMYAVVGIPPIETENHLQYHLKPILIKNIMQT